MKCRIVDSLAWLYADSAIPSGAEQRFEVDVARGGTAAAQVLVETQEPVAVKVASAAARVYQLVAVPVEKNTGPVGFTEKEGEINPHVTRRAPFEVFDAMKPLSGKARPAQGRVALYVQVPTAVKARPGRHEVAIDLAAGAERCRQILRVNVHPAVVPPVSATTLTYTNWFSLSSMATRHGLKPWSPGHWPMIRKYARLMVHGRQNMFWITAADVFTVVRGQPVLNADRLRRLVRLFTDAGMHYIEGPHLAHRPHNNWEVTQFAVVLHDDLPANTPEGLAWLGSMCRQLYAEIAPHGWQERWIQHVADEPLARNAVDYRLIAGAIRRYLPGIRLMDATITKEVAGALDIWVPQNWDYEKDREFLEAQRATGDEIWHYVCCFPGGPYLNRLLDGELLRPTLLHWGNALYDLPGFLHWGLNHYPDFQDPFQQSVVRHGDTGKFLPAGDTHIVYPGPGGPWSSVRLEAEREGAEDYELLRQLQRKNPRRAAAIIHKVIRSFKDYTKDTAVFRQARRQLLQSLP